MFYGGSELTVFHSTRWSTDANTDLKTSTSRTTTTATETVMMTATVTAAPMVRRAVNAQLRYNAANAIFESVLASGTESASPSTTPLNSEQMMAQAGMSTACLCMDVDPTSTVTSTFTAPAQVSVNHPQTSNANTAPADGDEEIRASPRNNRRDKVIYGNYDDYARYRRDCCPDFHDCIRLSAF